MNPLIEKINREVNQAEFEPETTENWSPLRDTNGKGDCDSYCTEKMLRLMAVGFPVLQIVMGILTCKTELGEPHAVLAVVDDDEVYILDNRTDDIRTYKEAERSGYRFDYVPDFIQEHI